MVEETTLGTTEDYEDDRRPPEQYEALLDVVCRHFPMVHEDDNLDPEGRGRRYFSVASQVWELDDNLRRCCYRMASYSPDLSSETGLVAEFARKHRPTIILRGLAKALKSGDRNAFARWSRQISIPIRRLIDEAKAEVTGEGGWTISETLQEILGPGRDRAREPDWLLAVFTRAAEIASKPGRRSEEWQDTAVRYCAELWSVLAKQPVRQPSHTAGASSRTGSMVAFVDDALAVYRSFGLRPTPRSGAAWKRILGS